MKYLSNYKLFENDSNEEQFVTYLQDISLWLNDEGILTTCEYHPEVQRQSGIRREYISFSLEKDLDGEQWGADYLTNRWIEWQLVKDVVIMSLRYMKSKGWEPSYIILDGESYQVDKLDVEEEVLDKFEPNRNFWGLQFDFIRI